MDALRANMHTVLRNQQCHPVVACLLFVTTTTVVIPRIDRGFPNLLLFSCQCGHCPFLFGGWGIVGCRVGIIYFCCLGYFYVYVYIYVYVYVYVRGLEYVCVFCLCFCLCSYFHSFRLGLCTRMSRFNFLF